jgi:hypothetical protein
MEYAFRANDFVVCDKTFHDWTDGAVGRVVSADPPPYASDSYPEEWVVWVSYEPGRDDQDGGVVYWYYGSDLRKVEVSEQFRSWWRAADEALFARHATEAEFVDDPDVPDHRWGAGWEDCDRCGQSGAYDFGDTEKLCKPCGENWQSIEGGWEAKQ